MFKRRVVDKNHSQTAASERMVAPDSFTLVSGRFKKLTRKLEVAKYAVMIEENDWDGGCTDFFQAHDEFGGFVATSTLEEAIKYVLSECGMFPPHSGKYTYHIHGITASSKFVKEIDIDWQEVKKKAYSA